MGPDGQVNCPGSPDLVQQSLFWDSCGHKQSKPGWIWLLLSAFESEQLTSFLFIDKVETEPQTLWALMRLSGKMHTELHTWLLFHLSDPLPQPHFPGGQSEESSGVLKSEDKGELVKVMGKGLGHATALRV